MKLTALWRRFYLLYVTVLTISSCSKNTSSAPTSTIPSAPVLTIDTISPTHGGANTSVTFSGTGFNSSATQNTVLFNGKQAAVTNATSSQLTATVPDLAGTGKVSITVNGNSATGPVFSYDTSYTVSTFATGFNNPQFIAEDANGNLYVTNSDTVSKVSKAGVVTTFASGLTAAKGITIDATGNLYVATNSNMNIGTIVKINPSGTKTPFATITGYVYGLSIDKDGNIYAANAAYGSVSKITSAGTVSTFASGLPSITDIVVTRNGNIYAVGSTNGTVYKITSSGQVSVVYSFVTAGFFGIAADSNENLFGTIQGNGSIAEIKTNRTKTIIANHFNWPYGILYSLEGDFYVADTGPNRANNIIYKITAR